MKETIDLAELVSAPGLQHYLLYDTSLFDSWYGDRSAGLLGIIVATYRSGAEDAAIRWGIAQKPTIFFLSKIEQKAVKQLKTHREEYKKIPTLPVYYLKEDFWVVAKQVNCNSGR